MLIHLFVTCSKARLSNWWNSKNGERITIDKNEIIYGMTDNFACHLGFFQEKKKSFILMPS